MCWTCVGLNMQFSVSAFNMYTNLVTQWAKDGFSNILSILGEGLCFQDTGGWDKYAIVSY